MMLVMRNALLGATTYTELFKGLDSITHQTLSDRLKRLANAGLLSKHIEGASTRYVPSAMGRDLRSVLLMIRNWQKKYIEYAPDRWIQGHFLHLDCGCRTEMMMACSSCHEKILPEHITSRAGPGDGRETGSATHGRRSVTVRAGRGSKDSHYFSIEGDRWSTLILAGIFKGYSKFAEFHSQLGIGKPTLSQRLKLLVSLNMLEMKPYQEGPTRYRYIMTSKGQEFYPVILALMAYGDKWLADDKGPPVILTHTLCNSDTTPKLYCDQCGAPILFERVKFIRE